MSKPQKKKKKIFQQSQNVEGKYHCGNDWDESGNQTGWNHQRNEGKNTRNKKETSLPRLLSKQFPEEIREPPIQTKTTDDENGKHAVTNMIKRSAINPIIIE